MSQQLYENFEPLTSNSKLRIIYEEMKQDLLPQVKKINPRIAADLGLLYIFRKLENDSDKEELLKFWRANSPHQVVQLPMGEFHYRPYFDFISLDKIMNGLYIENVLEQLLKFEKLSFYESCAILSDLERYFIVPLSVTGDFEAYNFLGYDAVNRSAGNHFECSALSCNHGADDFTVNKYCLFDDLEYSYKATIDISKGGYEPGPWYIVEVYRKNLPTIQ